MIHTHSDPVVSISRYASRDVQRDKQKPNVFADIFRRKFDTTYP